ncbi:hypothetical protein ACQ4PT_043822 [Festuca glaucescens]
MNDRDFPQKNHNSDSSEEDCCNSEEETIVLEAVSSIIKRSLKRKRRPSNIQKQKRTKIVRDRRQGRHLVDKDVVSAKSRYNVSSLVQKMQDFDENQKQYLRDIDFGSILDLTSGTVPWSFVQWLADHVDIKNEGFSFQQKFIPISSESFAHVLGVPAIGVPVPNESKITTAEFLQLFGLSEMPTIKFFRDKIKKGQEKVEFLRCFMIVALSSFYCPTSSTKPSTAYLGALMNIENIKSYNWAKFFQEWNLWYIKKYQNSTSSLAVCNYYIAVRYLDFLDFGSVQIQSSLPRISVWKGDMIKEYIKLDMDDGNFYGKLEVSNCFYTIKDIKDTCYGQAALDTAAHSGFSIERFRLSLDSFQQCTLSDKVKDSISSMFGDFAVNETDSISSKVQVHTDHDLSDKKKETEKPINSEFTTPQKLHAMFSGINNMGKENSPTLIDNLSGCKSSSIQCGQRTHNSENQLSSGRNINNILSTTTTTPDLSSESRIQSYSSHGYDGFENIGADDFEIDDGRPSLSLKESWLASPRGQVLRHEYMRKLAQRKSLCINEEELQPPEASVHVFQPPSPRMVDLFGTRTSPQRTNYVPNPNSPARNAANEIISISSQESPEVVFLRENRGSQINNSHDSSDDVYIGQHRLSPIRTNTSEDIDAIYEQDQEQKQYYQAIVRLANMDGFKHKMAIQIGNCKVSLDTFGNSFKPGGTIEAWVINLYCRILFLSNHPKNSNRHTFFHTSSEYFLEKWENETRRLYMKDQAIKAFEGAGKARKLHLTDSLHFPSLYNFHWFLFTVDIRDKKFIFMDSLFDKDSDLHQEVDNRMIMNFERTWNECRLKEIDFQQFEVIYPPVPKQNNGKDCGLHLMKSIELFKPRTSLMGKFSYKDMPNFRIQIANEMMFCEHNERHEIQEAVMTFKPHVHGKYARMG